MNSFLEWFKPGMKLKRWLLVIIIGILFLVLSLSLLIAENTPDIATILKITIEFVVGFLLIVFGIIMVQKRTLEIFIEANGVSSKKLKGKNLNMKSLIFDKNIFENGPKVVVIGGGAGLNTVISGIKKYTSNITAIVTLSDDVDDQEESRKELNLLPYVDIKESISALSENEEEVKKLLNLSFSSDRLKGLNFGDIYLLAMQEMYGNTALSIKKSTAVLNIIGEVVPVSPDELVVCAELTDGTVVKGKEEIPKIVKSKIETIKRVYVSPTNARPTDAALKAIEEADIIVIGPGNLYTNIIPNLLVKNISKAIKESKAIKTYVANIMTDSGQTDGYKLSDHIQAIFDHSGGKIFDFCISDTGDIIPEYLRQYHKKGEDVVEIDIENVKKLGVKVFERDLSNISKTGRIRHNSDAIAFALMEILMTDLKYLEKQDVMKNKLLESVLKKQRKIEKKRRKYINSGKNKDKDKDKDLFDSKKSVSAFTQKYEDRLRKMKELKEKEKQKLEEEKKEKSFSKNSKEDKFNLFQRTKKIVKEHKKELEEEQKKLEIKKDVQTKIEEQIEKTEVRDFEVGTIRILNKDLEAERKRLEAEELKKKKIDEKKELDIKEIEKTEDKEKNSKKEEKKTKETKSQMAKRKANKLLEELNKLELVRRRVREEKHDNKNK